MASDFPVDLRRVLGCPARQVVAERLTFVKHMLPGFVETRRLPQPPLPINVELTAEIDQAARKPSNCTTSRIFSRPTARTCSNRQASSFCDLFWAQVCGPDMPAVMKIVRGKWRKSSRHRDISTLGDALPSKCLAKIQTSSICFTQELLVVPLPLGDHIFAVAAAFDDKEAHAIANQLLDEWFATGYKKALEGLARSVRENPESGPSGVRDHEAGDECTHDASDESYNLYRRRDSAHFPATRI